MSGIQTSKTVEPSSMNYRRASEHNSALAPDNKSKELMNLVVRLVWEYADYNREEIATFEELDDEVQKLATIFRFCRLSVSSDGFLAVLLMHFKRFSWEMLQSAKEKYQISLDEALRFEVPTKEEMAMPITTGYSYLESLTVYSAETKLPLDEVIFVVERAQDFDGESLAEQNFKWRAYDPGEFMHWAEVRAESCNFENKNVLRGEVRHSHKINRVATARVTRLPCGDSDADANLIDGIVIGGNSDESQKYLHQGAVKALQESERAFVKALQASERASERTSERAFAKARHTSERASEQSFSQEGTATIQTNATKYFKADATTVISVSEIRAGKIVPVLMESDGDENQIAYFLVTEISNDNELSEDRVFGFWIYNHTEVEETYRLKQDENSREGFYFSDHFDNVSIHCVITNKKEEIKAPGTNQSRKPNSRNSSSRKPNLRKRLKLHEVDTDTDTDTDTDSEEIVTLSTDEILKQVIGAYAAKELSQNPRIDPILNYAAVTSFCRMIKILSTKSIDEAKFDLFPKFGDYFNPILTSGNGDQERVSDILNTLWQRGCVLVSINERQGTCDCCGLNRTLSYTLNSVLEIGSDCQKKIAALQKYVEKIRSMARNPAVLLNPISNDLDRSDYVTTNNW